MFKFTTCRKDGSPGWDEGSYLRASLITGTVLGTWYWRLAPSTEEREQLIKKLLVKSNKSTAKILRWLLELRGGVLFDAGELPNLEIKFRELKEPVILKREGVSEETVFPRTRYTALFFTSLFGALEKAGLGHFKYVKPEYRELFDFKEVSSKALEIIKEAFFYLDEEMKINKVVPEEALGKEALAYLASASPNFF